VGAAHVLIDESTAMSVTRRTRAGARAGFLTTGGTIFLLWNLFTLVGAVGGETIGDPRTFGLDAAVGGAFLALLWPRLAEPRNRAVAVLAVALALGVVPVAPAGVPVLAAGGVALLVGVLGRWSP
jgi:predicted branched-subunit amino acid permease